MISTCKMGCKMEGSKLLDDLRSAHILRTCCRSSIILSRSGALSVRRGPSLTLPLEIRVLTRLGIELYVSITVPRTTDSVTRTASLITKLLNSSPSGPNNSFKTGCRASFAEKSLSFLP